MQVARIVVLVALVLIGAVSQSCAGWWSGEAPSLGTAAFPVNQLRLVPRYRDGFEPVPFTVATQTDENGTPIQFVTGFFEEQFVITKQRRPLMATCQARIMMGDQGIGELYATYNGGLIRVLVEPENGWEDGTAWLRDAIGSAQVLAGMKADLRHMDTRARAKMREADEAERRMKGEDPDCDPGIFPAFITVAPEAQPQILPDGTIRLRCPQRSLNVKIVVPVSNVLDGEGCYVSLFVKHAKGKKLWEETSASFVASKAARVSIPNPRIAEKASAEPPLISDRIVSVTPPPATTTTTTTTATGSTPSFPCPWQIEKLVYQREGTYFGLPRSMPWYQQGYTLRTSWREVNNAGRSCFISCLVQTDGRILDKGNVMFQVNGGPCPSIDGTSTQDNIALETKNGVVYHSVPLGARVVLTYPDGTRAAFTAPSEVGVVKYWPAFQGRNNEEN